MSRMQEMRAGVLRAVAATRLTIRERRENAYAAEQAHQHSNKTPTEPPTPQEENETTEPTETSRDDAEVPHGLRVAAAWAWRLVILAIVLVAVLWVVGRLSTVVIPLSIALLLSALLSPMANALRRWVRLPRSLAAGLVLVAGLAAVVGA